MDPILSFFLEPSQPLHRRYEVLRAFFVEHRPQAEVAAQFGLTVATMQSLVRDFRAQFRAGQAPPFFLSPNSADPKAVGRSPLLSDRKLPLWLTASKCN